MLISIQFKRWPYRHIIFFEFVSWGKNVIHEIGNPSICLRTSLKIAYLITICEFFSLLFAYLSLCHEVYLVANQHYWQTLVFILENALYPIVYISESFWLRQIKDNDDPICISEKAIRQLSESVLSSSVPNLDSTVFVGIAPVFYHGKVDARRRHFLRIKLFAHISLQYWCLASIGISYQHTVEM